MKFSWFATALLLGCISVANAEGAAAFSSTQKAAIETIVHDYIVQHPEVLIEAGRNLQAKQQEIAEQKALQVLPELSSKLLSDANSPTAGNPKANVTVIEFFDYQCPHCKAMGKEITALLAADKNVHVIYKELPIFGADSEFAAKAALASAAQGKFDVFHNALLNAPGRLQNQIVLDIAKSVGLDVNALQAAMNLPQYQAELEANASLASRIGIGGTPAFIFVKNKGGKLQYKFVAGQLSAQDLATQIQSLNKK